MLDIRVITPPLLAITQVLLNATLVQWFAYLYQSRFTFPTCCINCFHFNVNTYDDYFYVVRCTLLENGIRILHNDFIGSFSLIKTYGPSSLASLKPSYGHSLPSFFGEYFFLRILSDVANNHIDIKLIGLYGYTFKMYKRMFLYLFYAVWVYKMFS